MTMEACSKDCQFCRSVGDDQLWFSISRLTTSSELLSTHVKRHGKPECQTHTYEIKLDGLIAEDDLTLNVGFNRTFACEVESFGKPQATFCSVKRGRVDTN